MKNTIIPRKWKDRDLHEQNEEVISPNSVYYANLSDKFEQYDYAEITNLNSTTNVIIILNNSQKQPLPRGSQAVINRKFISIAILNEGASDIEIGEIQINYKHNSKKQEFINRGIGVLSLSRLF